MKRTITVLLGLSLLFGFSLSGCSKTDKKTKAAQAGDTAFGKKDASQYSGTLKVWSWTDDPKYQIAAFEKAYPNIKVDFTMIGDSYDTKMQTIVDNDADGPDVFCADVKTVKNYIESGAWENLSAAPYNADAGDVMTYVKTIGSDAEGNLRALSWQATPGGFWYKRSLVKKYLGTDNPDEVSKMLSTMDSLFSTGETVYEKSHGKTFLLPNYQDLWTMACYSMRTTPWVSNGKFNVDDYAVKFFDVAKKARNMNLDAKLSSWSQGWYSAAANDSIIGYVLPTWGMQYVIQKGAPDSKGDWGIASMPASYFNGGTYMGIYTRSKEKELAWLYIKFVNLNKDYIEQYVKEKSDFPCLETVISDMSPTYSDAWCSGQNTFKFFNEEASKINTSLVTRYDDSINNLMLTNVDLYVTGKCTKEEAVADFKKDVAGAFHNVTVE